jgi:UDP-N-acetylmuramyl pentapeptide synthase
MVSIDHFQHELHAWFARAAAQGATNIVITSGELCAAIRMGNRSSDACCEAMEAETKPGDVVVVAKSKGASMTVRYLLPRTGQ